MHFFSVLVEVVVIRALTFVLYVFFWRSLATVILGTVSVLMLAPTSHPKGLC